MSAAKIEEENMLMSFTLSGCDAIPNRCFCKFIHLFSQFWEVLFFQLLNLDNDSMTF